MSNSSADPDRMESYMEVLMDRAEYSSSLVSSTSYGLYLAFSGIAVYLLLANGTIYAARRLTLAYTALMFVVTTTWYITGSRVSAYYFVDDTTGPELEGIQLTTKVCAMLQFLLSDSVMLFRLYMTWNRNFCIMILPSVMYLVCAIFGVLAELYCVSPWFESRSQTIRTVFFGTTVALNAFASLAIAYKVLVIMRNASRSGQRNSGTETRARTVLVVIIESGALYTVVGIVLTVYLCSQDPASIVLGTLFQALSFLNPAFIILRVAMGISYEYDTSQTIPRSTMTDLEKALPQLPLSPSRRESVSSFSSLDEKSHVIMVAKRVDLGLQ